MARPASPELAGVGLYIYRDEIMIAAISLIRRRADVSLERFRTHWLDPHGVMTAELPGLRRYWQSHCLDTAVTNDVARDLDIQGFPMLWFENYEARAKAYSSPRIADCNVDSEHFIGAVKRLVTEPHEVVRPHAVARTAKVVVLAVGESDPAWGRELKVRALALPGVVAYIGHTLLEQAAAPNSKIPELKLQVAGIAEVTFANDDSLRESIGRLAGSGRDRDRTALYQVEDYRLA